MKLSAAVSVLAALMPLALGQAAEWGQCGGQGWTGATTCVSGTTCTVINAYYSQCLPGTVSVSLLASRTPANDDVICFVGHDGALFDDNDRRSDP